MTFEEIERLLRRLERSDITALTVSDATSSLTLGISPTRGAGAASSGTSMEAGVTPHAAVEEPPMVRAPSIGHLRLRHPEAAPREDDRFPRPVSRGDIVAFLDCGVILRPVVADRDGTIGAPLQPDGALVGFGAPLFGYF